MRIKSNNYEQLTYPKFFVNKSTRLGFSFLAYSNPELYTSHNLLPDFNFETNISCKLIKNS